MIDWMHALGWTFFHSLWQSALILLALVVSLRLIPLRYSQIRYGAACAGLMLFVIVGVVTFMYFSGIPSYQSMEPPSVSVARAHDVSTRLEGWNAPVEILIAEGIEQNMALILTLWAAGFLFFSIRLSAGLLYTWKIRSSAIAVDNAEWLAFIDEAAQKIGIRRLVSLAETASISSPVVVGYLKPVILIPMGLLTGLSTEQLETIFLHELAHIRRHDYLINLLQSVVEAMFFFNPFVWVLSNIIRREREYCCDDMVIRYHGGTRAYAHALAKLAEAKIAIPVFALPLANNKNQLLNRIKRIMERSAKNSRKGKFAIPALLLVGSLMCISWLGMDESDQDLQQVAAVSAVDTVPDSRKGVATYSRKSIITIDENGEPHEEIVEEFNGDESLRPLFDEQFHNSPDAAIHGFHLTPNGGISGWGDTIPPVFGFKNNKEWQEFAESMQENFRRKFEMFERLEHDSLFTRKFADRWKSFEMPDNALRALEKFQNSEDFMHMEDEFHRLFDFDRFKDLEKEFPPFNNRAQGYEDALHDQLVDDGYLEESESIESLEWSDDSFKVNGKSIDKEDRAKYQELNSKFFGGSAENTVE